VQQDQNITEQGRIQGALKGVRNWTRT